MHEDQGVGVFHAICWSELLRVHLLHQDCPIESRVELILATSPKHLSTVGCLGRSARGDFRRQDGENNEEKGQEA